MSAKPPINKFPKYLSEGLGTFGLVFFGTGAIVVNHVYSGALTHVGVSLVFGLIVLAMIYTFGSLSGAHMNPAVTIGFLAARRMKTPEAIFYIVAQTTAAIAASLALRFLFPHAETLGQTLPSAGPLQSFVMEFILTAVLMLVILGVAHNARVEGLMAGVAIGAFVAAAALVAGPVSGASLNPARSLGPAVVSGDVSSLWIYLTATVSGAACAAKFFPLIHCAPSDQNEKVGCC